MGAMVIGCRGVFVQPRVEEEHQRGHGYVPHHSMEETIAQDQIRNNRIVILNLVQVNILLLMLICY